MSLDQIPSEIKKLRQWVVWKLEPDENGNPTKIPYNPGNPEFKASTTNAKTWGTFSQAVTTAKTDCFQGIGFVFSKDDPYAGIDLDKCGLVYNSFGHRFG